MANEANAESWWQRSGKTTLILVLLFVLALGIRTYFNYDASWNDGDYRWSGTDGYYHSRVIDHIVETGEFLLHDPLINYPLGAVNPRPPVYVWTIAALGGLLAKFGVANGDPQQAAALVAAFSPAVWGALTVFPLYFLGKEAFGRGAGLWAAAFLAITAAHIQRSNFGAVDHDSAILFFLVLAAAFFTRALQLMRRATYVADYRHGAWAGWRRFFTSNHAPVAYAVLTGASLGTIALIWKGFPYAFAIFAVWYGFQLLANHLRKEDSTGYFLLAVIPFLVTLAMIWPYYAAVNRVESAVYPLVYILLGVLAASLVFVPTRHLPPVLVLPVAIGAVVLGLLVMTFVLPHIGDLFFTGLGYFVQTKLYSTIAEAQRTQLGYLVFSIGIVPFFFAMAGIVFGISSFIKNRRDDHLFVTVWAAVGLFMAFTATRFIFNATTAFALLAGWSMARFIGMIDFTQVRKTWRNVRASGTGVAGSTRQALRFRHVVSALFIGLLVLLPNAWLAVDAGLPGEYLNERLQDGEESDREFARQYFGAFGQSFLAPSWAQTMDYLADQDQDAEPAERPGFMAWWDYGFYAAHLGKHPTVADPFQFGYQLSGRFIASQSEAEGITWMALRVLQGSNINQGGLTNNDAGAVLDSYRPGLAADLAPLLREHRYDEAYEVLTFALTGSTDGELDKDTVVDFYREVRDATGYSIRYFALEGRMFPCDDPDTGFVESTSIFYAPVYLADKNPDDFVQTQYRDARNSVYRLKLYETTEDGGSRQLDEPYAEDALGNRYILGGNLLYPMDAQGNLDYNSPNSEGIAIAGEELDYKDEFYNSLLYRAWVGAPPDGPDRKLPSAAAYAPGQGLEHFRLVYSTATRPSPQNDCYGGYADGVALFKYYDGAEVSGVVRDASGSPIEGAEVAVADNFGVAHATRTTDSEGRFTVLAPFSTDVTEQSASASADEHPMRLRGTGANELVVSIDGVVVDRQSFSVDDRQSMRDGTFDQTFDITIDSGGLTGVVFEDMDGDGAYNASADRLVSGANVSIADGRTTTTNDAGSYTFSELRPGSYTVSVDAAGYSSTQRNAQVAAGNATTLDLAVTPAPTTVSGVLSSSAGPVEGAQVAFEPTATGATLYSDPSGPSGRYIVDLPAGTYNVTVDYETAEGSTVVRYYTAEPQQLVIDERGGTETLDIELEREERS